MKKLYVIYILIFLVLAGIGTLLGYFQGIQKTFLPTNTAQNPAPAIEAPTLEEMRKQITTDTEAQRKKAMEEAEFQLYRYRNTFDSKPRTNKF